MPSATTGDYAVQSSSPELGSVPVSAPNEALKQVLSIIEKKVRNMEKRKSKLEDYKTRKSKGERLNQDQLDALSKTQEVTHNLEFARELLKSFSSLNIEIQKAVKKSARRDQLKREETEQRRLKAVLEVQYVLDQLGEEGVRQELRQVERGDDGPLLTEAELTGLDDFYKLVGPERDPNIRLTDQFEEASVHLWELMEGRDKAVAGTTYKALKDTLDKILLSGYFDQTQTHQNGVCEEEEEEPPQQQQQPPAPTESVECEEQPVEPAEGSVTQEFTDPIEVEATEFVNRKFIPEATYSASPEKEQGGEWALSPEIISSLQQQQQSPQPQQPPSSMSPNLVNPETHSLTPGLPPSSTDPLVRKQAVQDLMAQMQGTYNFMQDSMLEFDGQSLDPAIVSAQPMKSAQMVCAPAHTETRLPQHTPVSVHPEPTQVPMVSPPTEAYTSTPPLYQPPPHTTDPRPQPDPIDPLQVSMPLSSEQPPAPSSQPQAFQTVTKPLHSGINVNAAPFQSMQAVFNLNAPVPPSNEMESQKMSSQYQSTYTQSFSSQPTHSVEQQDLQQEPLQSVVGAFHSQDQGIPSSGGHQTMSQQPSGQGTGFGRQPQSYYSSRAVPRGGPRNARGAMNGYRGPSNGFRGGYDGYRAPFPNTPNTGYGQTQFSTPRDYSSSTYQREGYQQSFKRGAAQGARGSSRGRGGPYKPSRGMSVMTAVQTS
ncbi:caprin-1a isoform X1 [Clarias gariepinus]|uniref:caprin-1a isoform X1 n=1 Tax=Clarias gariepinus TaxID=13013 RepID=UPI00234DA42B|nr:caprin-1a isoform X1 [Clarias gariepinus]XP_053368842.1 caprin-1a isoform X1 [Clarias gariepinus]